MDTQTELNKGKLIFLHKLKNSFGQEGYLEMENGCNRRKISQLRLSAHNLEIEIGRHKGMDREKRLCKYCRTGEVESEDHFLFSCPNYSKERGTFKRKLALHNEKYKEIKMGIEFLQNIFAEKDHEAYNIFGNFIQKCWNIRNSMCTTSPKVILESLMRCKQVNLKCTPSIETNN